MRRKRILVADGDRSRGKAVVDALRAADLVCIHAPHGAAALELALATPPDLVVVEVGLSLVDGYKLAEILRANPRTRSARFLFLGSGEGGANHIEVVDRLIPATTSCAEIVGVVQDLLEKRQRIEAIDAATRNGDRIDGELANLPLTELLQVIHMGRQSGRIDLERDGDESALRTEPSVRTTWDRGFILLREGEILQAEVGGVEGEKALFRLLSWRRARFSFDPGPQPNLPPKILAPVRALLAEGMRQIAEWDRMALELPPLDAQIRLRVKSGELPNIVHPLTQEVLLLVEHYPRVRDVVDRCSFPDYQVLRTLHTLVERGIVHIGQVRMTGLGSPEETTGEVLFDEAQLRRLREELQARAPRGAAPVAGKILIVASEPNTLPDMLNLLRQVPGVTLAPPLEQGRRPRVELGRLAQICLDEDLRIDLIQLPAVDSHRPIWAIAGHGALGTLFLLSGPVGESAERVQEVSRVLKNTPRARVLHVVMLRRKERISPDELRENLSLIDESSLFLLPLESGKSPTALMRSLLSRVVP